jgi:hypothetical protein
MAKSAPHVEADRLYYVTPECQLRSLDTQGFRDGENDGPHREEVFQDNAAADIVWELDMCGRLGVFPHGATNSEVLSVGDLLMVSTSNGQNEGHMRIPSPRAPSLIAVNKGSGDVVRRAIGAGGQVLHGQWSSPVAADVNGRLQVLFGGGEWLAAYLRRDVGSRSLAIRRQSEGCPLASAPAHVWKHETSEAIWASILLADDRLYVGNVAGTMTVLRAGRRNELLAEIEMDAPLYSRPALIDDALYLATANPPLRHCGEAVIPKRKLA